MKRQQSLAKTGVYLVILVTLSKIASFVKQLIVAWYYGSNANTDIYYLADSTVALVSSAISTGIGIAVLSYYEKSKAELKQHALINNSLWIVSGLSAFIAGVVVLFSTPISRALAGSGYSSTEIALLSKCIRIMSITIITMAASSVIGASLEGNSVFLPTKAQSLFVSLISLFFVIIGGLKGDTVYLAKGYVVSYSLYLFLVFCISKRKGFLKLTKPKADSLLKNVLRMSFPTMISVVVIDINHMVDKIIAAHLRTGVVSALYYGQLASVELISSVLIHAFNGIVITKLTRITVSNDTSLFSKTINKLLCLLFSFSLIVCTIYLLLSKTITTTLFGLLGRGFSDDSLSMISNMIQAYSIGLLFIPFREIYNRVFYSFQESRTPFICSLLSVAINVLFSIVLSKLFGYIGIPIATTISSMINAIILFVFLRKKKPWLYLDYHELLMILFSGVFAFLLGIIALHWFKSSIILSIVCGVMVCLVYFGFLFLFKTKVSQELRTKIVLMLSNNELTEKEQHKYGKS